MIMFSTTANPDTTGSLWHGATFHKGENKGWATTLCGWTVIAHKRQLRRVVCPACLKALEAKGVKS